ncbi:MAG: threonine/serine exporter family protein [Clostridia bacterium]|nr:threonine/serine exporter family protein [Clostridia bacterium]MBR5501319.1 threonine/serine exporter family protein [Clostridia bacterium]
MNKLDWIQLCTAFVGSLGFGILFNIRGRRLLTAAFGGFLAWGLCLALGEWITTEPLNYFIVSLLVSVYAQVIARILKTPATPISITALIPLIPGSSLYYTMASAFQGLSDDFVVKAVATVEMAAALALGIIVVSALSRWRVKWKFSGLK